MILKHSMLKVLFVSLFVHGYYVSADAQGVWTQKSNVGGGGRTRSTGITIGSKGYLGLGLNVPGSTLKDWWEYDPVLDNWTSKAAFPGAARESSFSFAIGNKGYVGGGRTGTSNYHSDCFLYDPATNAWSPVASFTGPARAFAASFVIGNTAYVGTGSGSGGVLKDFYAYNSTTNTWTKKADFPGAARLGAIAFAYNGKGYMGTGRSGTTLFNDIWEYDPVSNSWTNKTIFPGGQRAISATFLIGNKLYVCGGLNLTNYYSDTWSYDLNTNTWTSLSSCPAGGRAAGVAFEISNKGYLASGDSVVPGLYFFDTWEFTPPTCTVSSDVTVITCDSYVSPSGRYTYTESNTYMDTVKTSTGCDSVITIHLTINNVPPTIAFFVNTLYTSYVANTYQWIDCLLNVPIPGAIGSSFSPTHSGRYAVAVSSLGCQDTSLCADIILGINTYQSNNFIVFPNPASDRITVQFDQPSFRRTIKVTDLLGKEYGLVEANEQQKVLELPESNGIYLIIVESQDGRVVQHVVKHSK